MQEAETIPHKFDEPFKLSGVDINSLFQESNLLPLSAQQDLSSQKYRNQNKASPP